MSSALKKKIIILGCVGLVFLAMYTFDTLRAKTFHIEVLDMLPNPAVADGQTPVDISVKLTNRHNTPVKGHAIFALAHTGGMFYSSREITNENGMVNFVFYPNKASTVTKLQDAVLSFTDESNSIFIEVGTTTKVILPLEEAEKETVSDDLLKGIFGD